jgi:hypothetical protein
VSRIIIRAYDGDPDHYDSEQPDNPENIGNAIEHPHVYGDGESQALILKLAELFRAGTHFDVRQDGPPCP